MLLVFLLLFLVLSSGSFLCAVITDKQYEEILPITGYSIVLVLFLFGIFGVMNTGFYFVLILTAFIYLVAFIELYKRQNFKKFIKKFITPGCLVFCIFFFFLAFFNWGKLADSWDEFSHWIDIVKVMVNIDDFGTNPLSQSAFQSYPPAMSIFQYFFQKINLLIRPTAGFSEWKVYWAFQIFFLLPAFPFFKKQTFKHSINYLILSLCIFLCPLIFYNSMYNTTYIDCVLALLSGYGLAMIALWNKKDWFYTLYISLLSAMLVLCKDVGLMFSLFLVIAYILDFFSRKQHTFQRKNIKEFIMTLLPFVFLLSSKILWKLEIYISKCSVSFETKIDLNVLINLLLGKDTSYRAEVIDNFWDALFTQGVTFQPLGITVTFVAIIIIEVLLFFFIYNLYKKKKVSNYKSFKLITIVFSFQTFIYILGLCFTYVFNFSEYEAIRLASFTRYLCIALEAGVPIVFLSYLDFLNKIYDNNQQQILVLSIFLLISPLNNVQHFISREYVKDSINIRNNYTALVNLINLKTDENDKIYFISQENSGFDFWVTRFSVRPRTLNFCTWSIGKPFYEGDIWTQPKTLEQWKNELFTEYDFVALYRINDYFVETYGELFEDNMDISNNKLYKVDKNKGLLIPCS